MRVITISTTNQTTPTNGFVPRSRGGNPGANSIFETKQMDSPNGIVATASKSEVVTDTERTKSR